MSAARAWRYGRGAGAKVWVAAILVTAAVLVGCVVDSSPGSSGGGVAYSGGGPNSSAPAPPSATPVLVVVDANQTLESTPGQGIGVYVEYETGGHWHVSWTCDTGLTNLSCNFVVDASVATGAITNSSSAISSSDGSLKELTAQHLQLTTLTTSTVDGVLFDTSPGAKLTVTVQLNAPVSFFFVQDGKVNGGYSGALTNPLTFEPSAP
jgi:hypothetical protein